MYKVVDKQISYGLSEAHQNNPLRWTLLIREGEVFTTQSCAFRCKDYFNDMVAGYLGIFFSIYGFNNQKYTHQEEGVYVLLTCLYNKENFLANLGSINKKAVSQGFPAVEVFDVEYKNSVVVLLPRAYFESTYYISLLSYLIRIGNNSIQFDSYESLVNPKINNNAATDHPFGDQEKRCNDGFVIPSEQYKDWPWLCNKDKDANLKVGGTIHDCGVGMWNTLIEVWAPEGATA